MHIKIKNKIAVIEFEEDSKTAGHANVMNDIIKHLGEGFKKFVFDFQWVDISFNSGVSGFLIVTVRKLVEAGAIVEMRNIRKSDMEMLQLVGMVDIDRTGEKIMYKERL